MNNALYLAVDWFIMKVDMFNNVGLVEVLIVAAVIFLVFGGKKLPEFAQGIIGAISEFKKAVKDEPSKKEAK